MTIEREYYNGPITILCDAKRCHEFVETNASDFHGALAKAKSRGWRPVLVNNEWTHLCSDCFKDYVSNPPQDLDNSRKDF